MRHTLGPHTPLPTTPPAKMGSDRAGPALSDPTFARDAGGEGVWGSRMCRISLAPFPLECCWLGERAAHCPLPPTQETTLPNGPGLAGNTKSVCPRARVRGRLRLVFVPDLSVSLCVCFLFQPLGGSQWRGGHLFVPLTIGPAEGWVKTWTLGPGCGGRD